MGDSGVMNIQSFQASMSSMPTPLNPMASTVPMLFPGAPPLLQQQMASTMSNAPTPPILPGPTMSLLPTNLPRPPIAPQQAAALMAAAAAALAAQQQRQQGLQFVAPRPLMPQNVRPPPFGMGQRPNLPGPPLPFMQQHAAPGPSSGSRPGNAYDEGSSASEEDEDGKSPRKRRDGKARYTCAPCSLRTRNCLDIL